MTAPAPDAQRAANRRGVLALTAAMACFVANDALVKFVSQSLPGTQLIVVRGLFAIGLLLGLCHALGATRRLQTLLDRRVLLRAAFDACATMAYLTSLFHLPLANATAINMATPLVLTLFAALALRERVGPRRWLALAAGFAGVLLVVQPRAGGLNVYALLCLGGTLLHASRDLVTRGIDRAIPSLLVTLSTALAVTLLAGLGGLVAGGWRPVTGPQLALLAAASVFLSGGYFLLTVAMRTGEMSLVAPFRYTGLLVAVTVGFLVWGDVPNALAWSGIALLVGAGLVVLHGERRPRAALDAAAAD